MAAACAAAGWLSVAEAARRLGVRDQTMRDAVRAGRVRSAVAWDRRLGRAVLRVDPASLATARVHRRMQAAVRAARANQARVAFAAGAADGDFYGGYGPPPGPTRARPGSPEKLQVLARRVEQRVSLFHPDDVSVYVDLYRVAGLIDRGWDVA